jgi:hypothetical protein
MLVVQRLNRRRCDGSTLISTSGMDEEIEFVDRTGDRRRYDPY